MPVSYLFQSEAVHRRKSRVAETAESFAVAKRVVDWAASQTALVAEPEQLEGGATRDVYDGAPALTSSGHGSEPQAEHQP